MMFKSKKTKIRDARSVVSVLENSNAFQTYQQKINDIQSVFETNQTSIINKINEYIGKSDQCYIVLGTNPIYLRTGYNPKYVPKDYDQFMHDTYITKQELDSIYNYFVKNGYIIKFSCRKVPLNLYRFLIKKPLSMKIIIDFNFYQK